MPEFIPVANPNFTESEAKAVYDTIKSGWISMGKKVQEFEKLVCDYTGAKYAIAMNNGTSTLHAILTALNIGPGDEVILPTLTYVSSANVILYTGATPVLCESDPKTFNVEPQEIHSKITKNTKAFMTVDLKGMPVDYDAFNSLSEATGIPFISDSAESLGSEYNGKKVGAQAFASSFSFFANKNITTGEGGMITTDNKSFYETLAILRNQGQEGRYNHTRLGFNYRMTDIQAALGVEQMSRIENILNEKNELAKNYNKNFQNIEEIKIPYLPSYVNKHSWYNYTITVDSNIRDNLIDYLNEKGIETRLSFPPIHIQPYYSKRFNYKPEDYSMAYESFQKFLDIPIWAGLNQKQQTYIINEIISFLKR